VEVKSRTTKVLLFSTQVTGQRVRLLRRIRRTGDPCPHAVSSRYRLPPADAPLLPFLEVALRLVAGDGEKPGQRTPARDLLLGEVVIERGCSVSSATASAMSAGTTTTPSQSPTMTSPGKTATPHAMGGTMGVNGQPDAPSIRPGPTIGDTGTGMLCAMGIVAALYQRMTTGRGQHIQIAMRDAMLNYCRTPMSRQAARDDVLPRGGNIVTGTAPGGLYKCAPGGLDDWCYIFASRGNEEHWRRLVRAIGRADLLDDPRMADGPTRAKNRAAVDAAITEWTSQRTKREVMEIIAGSGVPCGAVLNTLELLHDPDLHARGMMQKIDHPVRGQVTVPGWPLRMSDTKVALECAPIHGADSEAIYGEWLGCSGDEVKEMRQRSVI